MKFILKYLKPYALILICLLILQVFRTYGELKLPNVMSDLVNIGIQYNGFEEKAPNEISEQGLELLNLFSENSDLKNSYTKNSNGIYQLNEYDDTSIVDENYIKSCYALSLAYQDLSSEDDISLDNIYSYSSELTELDKTQYIESADKAFELSSVTGQVSISFSQGFAQELGYDLHDIQMDYIWKESKIMIIFMILVLISNSLVGLCATWTSTGVVTQLRSDLFMKAISFSNSEFDNVSVASIITRSTNDLQQVLSLLIMVLRLFLFSFMMAIGALIMAIKTSIEISWIPGVTIVLLIAIIGFLNALVLPKFKKLQKLVDKVNQLSRESLKGILVIRAFRNEKHTEQVFKNTNNELRLTNRFTQRILSLMGPTMMLLMNGCTLLIIWVGGQYIAKSSLSVGSLMAYIQYATHVVMSFMMVASMFIVVPRAMVSINRIKEVINTEPSIKDNENAITVDKVKGKIEFKNVSFKFNNAKQNALTDISFCAESGKTTAIIGSTGSGKSTLINLVTRLYDSTAGQILLDDIDIKNIKLDSLRNQIGYIPQKGMLFSGTIESNIKIGNENATEAEILEVLKIAQAKDFVENSEKGLLTEISQGGTSVSGGQRQRLSIARALIKNAPVYIFDDSFSALDLKTDAALRKALKDNISATIIIVAQRISTIMDADKIIVLDEGKIVGIGKHQDLLENCLTYKEIAESQLNKGGEE